MATNWFYENNGRTIGPIDEQTMQSWVRSGLIAQTQNVKSEESAQWRRAEECFGDLFPKSKAPDLLADISQNYFECDGFCFTPVLEAQNRMCRVNLYYQNRYSHPCHADITLRPFPDYWGRRAARKPLVFKIDCAGGEYGVIRQYYGIKVGYQGKQVRFKLGGKSSWPKGQGELLRLKKGLNAEEMDSSWMLFQALLTLIGLHISHSSAGLDVELPNNVADTVQDNLPPEREILWTMDQLAEAIPPAVHD